MKNLKKLVAEHKISMNYEPMVIRTIVSNIAIDKFDNDNMVFNSLLPLLKNEDAILYFLNHVYYNHYNNVYLMILYYHLVNKYYIEEHNASFYKFIGHADDLKTNELRLITNGKVFYVYDVNNDILKMVREKDVMKFNYKFEEVKEFKSTRENQSETELLFHSL